MKSYKDLDREIILNAPEGAMWIFGSLFYRHEDELLVFLDDYWQESSTGMSHPDCQQDEDFIPLPNTEIPWEATADSVCPVPDGANFCFYNGRHWHVVKSNDKMYALWSTGSAITKYKIIDEDYLAEAKLDKAEPIQEVPIHVPELEMHRAAYQAIKDAGFESPEELLAEHLAFIDSSGGHTDYEVLTLEEQLTNKLKFLQNLANEFPEIYDEVVAEMKVQFECYCEENLND